MPFLRLFAAGPPPISFLLLQRPMWLEEPAGTSTQTTNLTMKEVATKVGDTLPGVEMVVSGHVHGLDYFSFGRGPIWVISGGAGFRHRSRDAEVRSERPVREVLLGKHLVEFLWAQRRVAVELTCQHCQVGL
jgi:hypothetical protein